jgi:uncharacterized protein (TIGR00730 family)
MIKRICVYCGSNFGTEIEYARMARAVGQLLAERGITLVYGGGKVGLMGEIAQTVIAHGGEVIGVIPGYMVDKELAFKDATDLRIVENMHERKAEMASLADAFIALPGGLGTLEEISEILTWAQLGLHQKPCGLLNVNGFFDPLILFLDRMVAAHFLHAQHRAILRVDTDPAALLASFETYQAPKADKAAMALKDLQSRGTNGDEENR